MMAAVSFRNIRGSRTSCSQDLISKPIALFTGQFGENALSDEDAKVPSALPAVEIFEGANNSRVWHGVWPDTSRLAFPIKVARIPE